MIHDIKTATVEIQEILKGELNPDRMKEGILLKGDLEVGGTYLLLLNVSQYGTLRLSSREGSLISIDDPIYKEYLSLF
jgi:hypothetical protein